jgi:hypothetical protein
MIYKKITLTESTFGAAQPRGYQFRITFVRGNTKISFMRPNHASFYFFAAAKKRKQKMPLLY